VNQPVSLAVNGIGGVPNGSLAPSPAVFLNQNINSTSTLLSVTLINSGTAPLTAIVASIIGADAGFFAIAQQSNSCGSSLAATSSCFNYVTFTPTAGTNYAAMLSACDKRERFDARSVQKQRCAKSAVTDFPFNV
jgi:hypothetical protein